jgi:hypothetical protein
MAGGGVVSVEHTPSFGAWFDRAAKVVPLDERCALYQVGKVLAVAAPGVSLYRTVRVERAKDGGLVGVVLDGRGP